MLTYPPMACGDTDGAFVVDLGEWLVDRSADIVAFAPPPVITREDGTPIGVNDLTSTGTPGIDAGDANLMTFTCTAGSLTGRYLLAFTMTLANTGIMTRTVIVPVTLTGSE